MRVAGCDCGKNSLHVCVLDKKPANLKQFVRSYTPIKISATRDDIEQLIQLADVYAIEPTGDYSRLFIERLKAAGKEVRLVSARRVKHYREYHDCTNKADKPDAAAIAAYTLENLDDPTAFLGREKQRIRELYLQIKSTSRNKNPICNRLGQRLTFEYPEYVKTYEHSDRAWLDPDPPAPYRFLAGEGMQKGLSRREADLAQTIGVGVSDTSRKLAAQLCEFERQEYNLEQQLQAELDRSQFASYHAAFDYFAIPERTRCALLSIIYPFQDYLDNDGTPIIEYVRGETTKRRSGMTKRDRSEGKFKLSLGMGKVKCQSGGEISWKAGGSKFARTAIYLYVDRLVKTGRGKNFEQIIEPLAANLDKPKIDPWLNADLVKALAEAQGIAEGLAALRIHYHFQNSKADRRVMATAGRFVRMLYKELQKVVN